MTRNTTAADFSARTRPAAAEKSSLPIAPTFGPLVDVCKAFGLGRTTAFSLAASGQIESFLIGTRRFCYIASVESLPRRLAAHKDDSPQDVTGGVP